MIKMEKKMVLFFTLFIRRWYFLRLAVQLQNRNIINHSTLIVWLPKYTEHPHLTRSSVDTNNLFWFILHSCSGRCKRQHKTLRITQSFQYKLQVPRFLHFIWSVQRTLELSTTMNETMNPLTNNTLACSKPLDSQATRLSIIVAYCVIFVVSAVGNCSIALIVEHICCSVDPELGSDHCRSIWRRGSPFESTTNRTETMSILYFFNMDPGRSSLFTQMPGCSTRRTSCAKVWSPVEQDVWAIVFLCKLLLSSVCRVFLLSIDLDYCPLLYDLS